MPVSLHDSMRPVAIAFGLGAGAGGERGISLLASVAGGLAFGIIAFLVVGRLENLWFARVVAQPTSKASEASYVASYAAIFFVLPLATIAGCLFGRWVLHEMLY
jgi:hypothetical protein